MHPEAWYVIHAGDVDAPARNRYAGQEYERTVEWCQHLLDSGDYPCITMWKYIYDRPLGVNESAHVKEPQGKVVLYPPQPLNRQAINRRKKA